MPSREITIRIPTRFLPDIDELRGELSRKKWIKSLIKTAVKRYRYRLIDEIASQSQEEVNNDIDGDFEEGDDL